LGDVTSSLHSAGVGCVASHDFSDESTEEEEEEEAEDNDDEEGAVESGGLSRLSVLIEFTVESSAGEESETVPSF